MGVSLLVGGKKGETKRGNGIRTLVWMQDTLSSKASLLPTGGIG